MVNIFNVQKPRDNFAPVPANVVAPMFLRVKRGPDGGVLTPSQSSKSRHLNCEVTFTDGLHKGAKAFLRLTVERCSDQAKEISLNLIGSIVRSAIGVRSDDMSPEVAAKLADFNFEDLDGIRFIGKTGRIERGKLRDPNDGPNGDRYDDKTTIACGVTPDMDKDWKLWAISPRGFNTGNSGNSGVVIDTPPWAE